MPVNVTVNAVCPNVQYVADGSQTEFGFPFAIFSAADLEVYLDHVLQTEGFSITVNLQSSGGASGGTVRFSQSPVAGTKITLRRQIVIQRTTNFQESGELRARALNYELDYLTAALQQLDDVSARTIHQHPTDVQAKLTLPIKTERAGKALTFDAEGNVSVGTVLQAEEVGPRSLDDIPAGVVNSHFTATDKVKLDGIAAGAQVNPADLDGVPNSASRLAMTNEERTKLDGIADHADVNPPAATDPEIDAGIEGAARTLSPAQIKAAVAIHAPVTSVAGHTGGVSLSQADVSGTVPETRQLTVGAGLTGGGDFSADRAIAVDLAPSGEIAGTATTVARADHSHAPASPTVAGLLSAADKVKLDGIADHAEPNPPAATDPEIDAGIEGAARTLSPAQIKAAVATHAPVASVAGRTGAVSLSQADVSGTVPETRQLTVGAGLTGGGDLSADRSITVDLAPAGETAGASTTVARADHSHAPASPTVAGLLSAADKVKLNGIADHADANPPAATDPEIAAGIEGAARTLSPVQIKTAIATHAPVTSVAGRTGAVTLNPADVPGTVVTTRRVTAGVGLTGGGDLTSDRTLSVAMAPAGGANGTATTVSRSDHSHVLASDSVNGMLAASDKVKLDGIAANANPNPPTATDPEIAAGTEVAARTVSPAQIKTAITTHATVASVAGRTGVVSLSQADVQGTIPSTRRVAAGVGLTGGGDLSIDRTLSVALAASGGTNGTLNTVARSDHTHAVASGTANGLLSLGDKAKLDTVALYAAANPPAATDPEIAAGTEVDARIVSPAQIKTAIATHAPVTSVASRTGAVSLTQADVSGSVPETRQLTVGAGLTGGGDLSADRGIAVDLAPAGLVAGTATTVSRADHTHSLATAATAGLLSASDKTKLDGVSSLARNNLLAEFAGGAGYPATTTAPNARIPLGGSGRSVKLLDLSNLTSFQVVAFTGASYTNVHLGAEFSRDGGASWVSSDGSPVANTAFPVGGSIPLNVAAGVPATGTINVPNGWATISTLVRWSLWHTTGGTAVTVTQLSALSNATLTIPAVTADSEWRTHGVLVGGSTVSTTTTALSGNAGSLTNIQGSHFLSNTTISLAGTPQYQIFANSSSSVPGCYIGIVFTVDGGVTWVWPDGTPLNGMTPHINGDANAVELVASPGEQNTRVLNLVSWLQVSNVRCRGVLYDKLTVGARAINHLEIRIQRAYVLGSGPSITSVAGKTGIVTLTREDVGIASLDDVPDGSSRVGVSPEDRVKLLTVATNAAANPPDATDLEITAGTSTAARTITPAQMKLAAETHGGRVNPNIVDFGGTYLGVPGNSAMIGQHVSISAWTLPAGLTDSIAYADRGPTSFSTTISVRKNGVEVATIGFATGATTGVFSGSETAFSRGDRLSVHMPAAVNGMRDISYVIAGTL